MKNFLAFVGSIAVALVIGGYLRTLFGAEVGEPCNDFILSCRATRGVLTVNACVHDGAGEDDTFCSYMCEATSECPEGWACEAASAYSNVPGAVEDVDRVCRRPH